MTLDDKVYKRLVAMLNDVGKAFEHGDTHVAALTTGRMMEMLYAHCVDPNATDMGNKSDDQKI